MRGAIPGQPNVEDWCEAATPEDYPQLDGGDCWDPTGTCYSNLVFEEGTVAWILFIQVIRCGETWEDRETLHADVDYGTWAYDSPVDEDSYLFQVGDMDWTITPWEMNDLWVEAGEYAFELE